MNEISDWLDDNEQSTEDILERIEELRKLASSLEEPTDTENVPTEAVPTEADGPVSVDDVD